MILAQKQTQELGGAQIKNLPFKPKGKGWGGGGIAVSTRRPTTQERKRKKNPSGLPANHYSKQQVPDSETAPTLVVKKNREAVQYNYRYLLLFRGPEFSS